METRKRTGREAINRIIWDERLDQGAFVVGYVDRLAATGVLEKPMTEWQEGDIPSHRISYIHCNGIIVWRRGEAGDRLDDERLPQAAWAAPEV